MIEYIMLLNLLIFFKVYLSKFVVRMDVFYHIIYNYLQFILYDLVRAKISPGQKTT